MTSYFEYGVNLTDNQKSKLASAIRNKPPLTLRLKHSNLQGDDELMLTKSQIAKIKKIYIYIANGSQPSVVIARVLNKNAV